MKDWDDAELTEFLFETGSSLQDFAREHNCSLAFVSHRIKSLGLDWVTERAPKVSRGQASLMKIMHKLLPGEKLVTEEAIGERLRLDIYCPAYNLAAEYHGKQHFEYIEHFHGNIQGFWESQKRDNRKIEICKDLGISLVVFRYNDDLSEDIVFERLLDAIRNSPVAETKEKRTLKGNAYYEAAKQRQREYKRESYRRMRAGQ